MKIKILFLDLDGTALNSDQITVSEKNMRAINAVLSRGILVVPCTGRVLDMYPPQIMRMREIRYCITSHGARVVDRERGISLYEKLINPINSLRVCSVFENRNIYAEIAAQNTIFIEKAVDDELMRYPVPPHHKWYMMDEHDQIAVRSPGKYFLSHGIQIEKINIYGIPEELRESMYNDLTNTGCIKHTREGAGENLEFSSCELNKIEAVDCFLKYIGIPWDDCMMIGDSSSDIDMINKCGLGIAMQNAPGWIREQADWVAPPNTESGVAEAIREFILQSGK